MSFFKATLSDIESFFNPSNEQKALNAVNALAGQVQVVLSLSELVPALAPLSTALSGIVAVLKTVAADLQAVINK